MPKLSSRVTLATSGACVVCHSRYLDIKYAAGRKYKLDARKLSALVRNTAPNKESKPRSRGRIRMGPVAIVNYCHLHLCIKQLIYISALSKLRESAEITAVRYTNLNGIKDHAPTSQ